MKKSVLVVVSILLIVLSVMAQNGRVAETVRSEWRKFNPVTPLTAASFARPPAVDQPWVRMNIPATADPTEIKAEVRQLHDSGIAGIEIGQGAFPNNDQLVALLTAANQLGVKVSLSHGPTKNPVGYSMDADHARKSLFVGKATVNAGATFQGVVPPPTQTQGSRSGFGLAPGRGPAGPTQGDAKTDVAVYMQNYLYPPSQSMKFRHWGDAKLQEAGYTRDYLNPNMLNLPNAIVTGKRLAANGPAYKALIIDSEQGPPTDPVKTAMPVEVARKILGYARAGLPIIVIGTPPDRTPGNKLEGDATLKSVIGELLAERSVSRVAHESDVPDKLRSLGIRPAAEAASPSSLLSIRRRDDVTKTDYYFFYNQGIMSPPDEPATLFEPATGQPVECEISLEGRGQPYLLDAWSGKITPIVNYKTSGDRTTLRLRLARDNGVLIALSEQPNRFGVAAPTLHLDQTTADEAVVEGNTIVIRAAKSGTYSTTLSNGRTIRSTIAAVPAAIDLTKASWSLKVEDWQPVNPYVTTFGAAAAETRKTQSELELKELQAWPAIPALQNASGIGVYTTSFELPSNWTKAHGARLNLGEVFDTFTVVVNDRPAPLDQISAEGDISAYLKPGRNTIVVRVAMTLNNRLVKLDEDVAKRGIVQPYGLVGPVVLTPYRQATVWQKTGR